MRPSAIFPQALAQPRGAAGTLNVTISRILLLGPALLLILTFFVAPLLYMLRYSLARYDAATLVVPIWTFENYAKFLRDEYTQGILLRTFRISALTTVATLILGYPFAYYMTMARGIEKMALAVIALTPTLISHIILGYAWLVLLAPQSGILSNFLQALGMLSSPLRIMYTEWGILIGLTHFTLVYMVLSLHSALEGIDPSLLRAGAILGATPLQAFRRITLPLSLPGIFSGCILTFSISSSAFMIPFVLGGRQLPMLSVLAYDLNTSVLNWPLGATTGLVLLIISALSIAVFGGYVTRLRSRLGMA